MKGIDTLTPIVISGCLITYNSRQVAHARKMSFSICVSYSNLTLGLRIPGPWLGVTQQSKYKDFYGQNGYIHMPKNYEGI